MKKNMFCQIGVLSFLFKLYIYYFLTQLSMHPKNTYVNILM